MNEMSNTNTNNQTIGRNQPCPCGLEDNNGKPKKYKMCCDSKNTCLDYWDTKKKAEKVKIEYQKKFDKENWEHIGKQFVWNTKQYKPNGYSVTQNVKNYIKDIIDITDLELREEWGMNSFWHFQNECGLLILSWCRNRGDFHFEKGEDDMNSVNVEWIFTNPDVRNSGWGTDTMEKITELADKNDVTLFLHACCGDGEFNDITDKKGKAVLKNSPLSDEKLVSWYEKFGFDVNPYYWDDYQTSKLYDMNFLLTRPSPSHKSQSRFNSMLGYDGKFGWDCSVKCWKNNRLTNEKIRPSENELMSGLLTKLKQGVRNVAI